MRKSSSRSEDFNLTHTSCIQGGCHSAITSNCGDDMDDEITTFFLLRENIIYTLCDPSIRLDFHVGLINLGWWDLIQVSNGSWCKWLGKRKEEHGTSLWVQELGTKHQIQGFCFRYRNHPKNLLVSYLSTHPTSTSTSIFKESIYEPYLKSQKCWERTKKRCQTCRLDPTPGSARLHHIAYQCLDRRGLMGWWKLP